MTLACASLVKAEDERRDRADQSGAEPDHILCIVGQMVARQRSSQK